MHYRNDIDGLRAFSVLTVLIFHLSPQTLTGGFLGVDVFFVISGYLISTILLTKTEKGTLSLATFYARRIKRIFPALFSMMIVTFIIGFLVLAPEQYKTMITSMAKASLQISNIEFAQGVDYFQSEHLPSPVLHTWSLGVEEQFYLIWPLVILLTYKFLGLTGTLYGFMTVFILSFLGNILTLKTDPVFTFYMLPTRAWELALGGILAVLHLKNVKLPQNTLWGWSALAVLLVCTATYTEHMFPGFKALLPCLCAIIILHTGQYTESSFHKFLKVKPLAAVGLISYSLYLWHWPLIIYAQTLFGRDLSLLIQASIIALSFALATMSYRYIEQPIRQSTASARKTILIGLVIMGSAFGLSDLARHWDDIPLRFLNSELKKEDFGPSKLLCFQKKEFTPENFCTLGDPDGSKTAILAGESHAGHYTDLLDAWGKQEGVAVTVSIKDDCNLWFDIRSNGAHESDKTLRCIPHQEGFKAYMQNEAPQFDYVFLGIRGDLILERYLSGTENSMDTYQERLEESLKTVQLKGKETVILGQVPMFETSPYECYFKYALTTVSLLSDTVQAKKDCLLPTKEESEPLVAPTRTVIQETAQKLGITYYDPSEAIYSIKETEKPYYQDVHHITPRGSLYLLEDLSEFMNR